MMRGISGTHSGSDIESDIESHLPPPPPPCPPPVYTRANVLRASALMRVSQSEPHLDIPHFVHGQDPQHVSSLTRVLSGLVQVDSALSTPFSRSQRSIDRQPIPNAAAATVDDTALARVKSKVVHDSGEYSTSASSDQTSHSHSHSHYQPLRKSSSSIAVNWSSPSSEAAATQLATLQQFTPSFHQDSSGLTMSAAAAVSSSSHDATSLSSAVAKAFNPNEQPIVVSEAPNSDITAAERSSSNNSSSHEGTIDERPANAAHHHNRGVLGLFGRGFFAKAVIRSEEENYRYLMALDRN